LSINRDLVDILDDKEELHTKAFSSQKLDAGNSKVWLPFHDALTTRCIHSLLTHGYDPSFELPLSPIVASDMPMKSIPGFGSDARAAKSRDFMLS
jgi:hypothetical protein